MSKGVQIAGGATLIALLLGWYASSNLETITYYQTLAEFQVEASDRMGEAARVHGYVALGSIERDVASKQVRFAVQNEPPHAGGSGQAILGVVLTGLETPDLFKDGAEVVLEGRLSADGGHPVFHADKVMAKCPSKFEAELTESAEF